MKQKIWAIRGYLKKSKVFRPAVRLYSYLIGRYRNNLSSNDFWEKRYLEKGNSGPGSYGRLAEFKARIINDFVTTHTITSVIEFGCGDGNQLSLAKYPEYLGIDVSQAAIKRCRDLFAADATKRFSTLSEYSGETADLALSLDVIYHLVEDEVFVRYMNTLFLAADRYVIIYSSDKDHDFETPVTYIRHRKFTQWILEHMTGWELVEHIPNPYPLREDVESESFADFYIYRNLAK
jgi:SAM-dependent methyltransferase